MQSSFVEWRQYKKTPLLFKNVEMNVHVKVLWILFLWILFIFIFVFYIYFTKRWPKILHDVICKTAKFERYTLHSLRGIWEVAWEGSREIGPHSSFMLPSLCPLCQCRRPKMCACAQHKETKWWRENLAVLWRWSNYRVKLCLIFKYLFQQ